MPLFEWKPIYSVNIAIVDSQHQKLIGYMNQYHESHGAGDLRTAKTALESLLRYTRLHFADEEKMLARHGYPDFEAHCAAHRQLLSVVEMLAAAYLKEPSPMNAEKLGKYLKTWLASHILGVDKKYGPYLHEQGIH